MKYPLSLLNVEELLAERGIDIGRRGFGPAVLDFRIALQEIQGTGLSQVFLAKDSSTSPSRSTARGLRV